MPAWLRDLGLSGRRQIALLRLRTQHLQAALGVRLALTTLTDLAGKEASKPRPRNRQLLVDVSVIVRGDARTGIQRVVRAIVQQLLHIRLPDSTSSLCAQVAGRATAMRRVTSGPNTYRLPQALST